MLSTALAAQAQCNAVSLLPALASLIIVGNTPWVSAFSKSFFSSGVAAFSRNSLPVTGVVRGNGAEVDSAGSNLCNNSGLTTLLSIKSIANFPSLSCKEIFAPYSSNRSTFSLASGSVIVAKQARCNAVRFVGATLAVPAPASLIIAANSPRLLASDNNHSKLLALPSMAAPRNSIPVIGVERGGGVTRHQVLFSPCL